MNKISISNSKILKLNNVLIIDELNIEDEGLSKTLNKMDNYIKLKGSNPIGPLIQYTNIIKNELGEYDINIKLIRQIDKFINSVEYPYNIKSVIRIRNCIYCRYIGPEEKLKFAYDKINLTAFEEEISLKGDSYTIFIDKNEEDDTIIADVFMERAD